MATHAMALNGHYSRLQQLHNMTSGQKQIALNFVNKQCQSLFVSNNTCRMIHSRALSCDGHNGSTVLNRMKNQRGALLNSSRCFISKSNAKGSGSNIRCLLNSSMSSTIKQSKQHIVSNRLHFRPIRNQTTKNKSTSTSNSQPSSSTTSSTSTSLNQKQQIETLFENMKNKLQHKLLQPRIIPIPRWISPRSYSFTLSECFGHASFILVAISYATDDFLLLRIIAVAGSTSMLFFTYFHPHGRVLWLPFQWNFLFILINAYRIGNSLYYKYVGHFLLSEDKKRVRDEYFAIMDTSDFAKLCSIAEEEEFRDGEMVVFQGQKNPYVRMVIEGELDVLRDGIKTYTLEEGNFISESGLHAGLFLSGTLESCCTIVAQRDEKQMKARCLKWDRTELISLLKQNSGLRRSLKAVLSWDIVRKLKQQRHTIAEGTGEGADPRFCNQKRQEQGEDRYAAILQNMLQHPEYFRKRKSELDHYRRIHVRSKLISSVIDVDFLFICAPLPSTHYHIHLID
jgi:CRP-like cAMP-binding protein